MLFKPINFLSAILFRTIVSAELSIKTPSQQNDAAKSLAGNLMSYYTATNGLLPPPYYAWESATMWTTMIGYSVYTGDTSYNSKIATGIAAQAGSSRDFMGAQTPGNDDQLWWGLAAMVAAEVNLPLPTSPSIPSWEKLATNVFDQVIARWDNSTCNGGGLHWQISPSANGYSYKNSITNSLACQLAVRLADYTGEEKYLNWANKIWQWMLSTNLIDPKTYAVYDGTDSKNNCADLNHDLWSYNVAVPMYAVARLSINNATWQKHLDGLVNATASFFTHQNVLVEKCEASKKCNADQLSFKAYLVRWMAEIAAVLPETRGRIVPVLEASVEGALKICDGGPKGNGCGVQWTTGNFDGTLGVGQQMAALETVLGWRIVQEATRKDGGGEEESTSDSLETQTSAARRNVVGGRWRT